MPPALGFGALVLDGEVGIGKTTLWEEAVRRASERSWAVLSTRAAQAEVRLSYVGLSDLLARVPAAALDELPRPQRQALDVALLRVEPGGGGLGQRAVATGFLSVLERLSRLSSVLVAVDDAQWLDGASALLLEFVARRLRSQPVGFVMAQRTGEPEPFPFERACARLQRIEIGPLGSSALQQVIRAQLGSPLSRSQLLEVERLCGGNPLFALELARAFAVQTDLGNQPPRIPATLGEAVLREVRALPLPTRGALLVAALAADPKVGLVDQVALSPAVNAAVVQVGRDETIVFRHPLYAWAVSGSASASEHRTAHAALARLVENPEERVRHLALGAADESEELAVQLEEAATAARARGAPASAGELLSHALRLTPRANLDDWGRRCVARIPVLLEAGDWDAAWALGQEAIERLPAGPARAAVLVEASMRHPGAAALCLQALEEAAGDPVLSIRAQFGLAVQELYRFDTAASLERSQIAVDIARRLGDRSLIAMTASFLGAVRFLGGVGNPMPDLDEALQIERELGFSVLPIGESASAFSALWLVFTDELESAKPLLEEMLLRAIETGDEGSQAQVLSFLFMLESHAGDWARAHTHIESSRDLADLMEFSQGRGEKRALLAMLQAHLGELDAARANIDEGMAISDGVGDRIALLVHLSALAFISLSIDDPAAALVPIDRIRQVLPAGSDAPVWLDFEGDEIEALVAVNRTSEAEQRIASLEQRASGQPRLRLRVWASRGKSLLLASQGDLAGALAALETALRRDDLPRAPFEHARTLLVKGQLERRAKHKQAARETLEQAAGIFDQLGAALWSAKARRELARISGRRRVDGLTETELRIAELVAAGRSNKEVASELFVTVRTVEWNLTRIYLKLGVRSRSQLASRFVS